VEDFPLGKMVSDGSVLRVGVGVAVAGLYGYHVVILLVLYDVPNKAVILELANPAVGDAIVAPPVAVPPITA
jgi:hypothetical protein